MANITTVKERINQLNQAKFQILCDAVLSKEGYPGIVALGTKDGTEKTTPGTPDTYFCLNNGKYVFAEYTTQKAGLIEKIRGDIDKCLDEESIGIPLCEIAEIVYCHTSSNIKPTDDRTLKKICEEKSVQLTLIGIDSLADMLMNHPVIVKDYLGLSIDSGQIQSVNDFIKEYNSNAMAASLETVFLFRKEEIAAIDKSFENVKVVLLVGPAGTGKTRLALEYAKHHADMHNEQLLCIHDRSIPMYEDLKLYFEKSGDYFVFVDDANQLSELEHIIEYVNKEDAGYHIHILMTVRDYAISKVKTDVNGIVGYDVVEISSFTDDEIKILMKTNFDIQNPLYLDRIVQISEGNARIAMLAGKIACDSNRLDSIRDVSGLYENYYGKALNESGIDSENELLVTAGIMAFLNAIHLDHIDPIIPILEKNGLSKTDFVDNIFLLHEHEIVDICNDKGVRFSDQCLANFVLKYAFFDKKRISLSMMIECCFTSYKERTVQAVNTLLRVFQNDELLDYVEKEILAHWKKLENENSPCFLEFVKTFYPVNEVQALMIIQKIIDNTVPVTMNVDDIDTESGKNYNSISDDVISVLGGFSYLENLDMALDLFFQYYLKRPDLYMQFYHASTSLFSIDKNSAKQGYRTQIKYFTKIAEYSQAGNDSYVTLLFCDIASHFLQFEFSPCENARNGKGIVLYNIPIVLSQFVEEYRSLIWKQLIVLSSKECWYSRIKKILYLYGKTTHKCSKELIKSEADYICKLSMLILSPESLNDCLVAQSIIEVFEKVDLRTDKLQTLCESKIYKIFQLVIGTKWNFEITFEERKKQREDNIRQYIASASDRIGAFKEILQLYMESVELDNRYAYEISSSVNIALRFLSHDKHTYLACVTMFVSCNNTAGIDCLNIVENMFKFLSPQKVLAILEKSPENQRTTWLYAYYHVIPQEFIDERELQGLYSFLDDDSDQSITTCSYRDILFLDKYLTIDENAILTASNIILKKKEYSTFMVCIYFGLLFNEHHIQPNEVIKKFARDIKLLEQIYLCVIENDKCTDCRGLFLHELFHADKSFIKEYISWFIKTEESHFFRDHDYVADVIYREEDYLDILDFVVDESITTLRLPSIKVPAIIKRIIVFSGKNAEKCDNWVRHFIICNCNNKDKIRFLFEAIAEESISDSSKYISLLVNANDNYDIFEEIPLTPLSYSWSGSVVPMYSSWINQLENLLPLFSGLKYIKHKNRVQQLIKAYRERIREEEIADILGG